MTLTSLSKKLIQAIKVHYQQLMVNNSENVLVTINKQGLLITYDSRGKSVSEGFDGMSGDKFAGQRHTHMILVLKRINQKNFLQAQI